MAEQKVGRGSDQFPLRLPDGMRELLKRRAEENGRSMNSEIVALIELAMLTQADTKNVHVLISEQEQEIKDANRRSDEWRSIAQSHVKTKNSFTSIFKSFCKQVISEEKNVPPHISELARELITIADTNMDQAREPVGNHRSERSKSAPG